MQIFVLNKSAPSAVKALCDKHILSQIGETAELMAIAHYRHSELVPPLERLRPRILKHKNHPCAVWVAHSGATYTWTAWYAEMLCAEYSYRYGKVHAYQSDIDRMMYAPFPILYKDDWLPWMQVIPEPLRQVDAVKAYREYYKLKSQSVAMRWTGRGIPAFMGKVTTHIPALSRAYN